jgi:Type I phosphodiesterase / nucleotide pyrophosphatase
VPLTSELVAPDYAGACVSGLIPALLGPRGTADLPHWFPEVVRGAKQVVLLVLDGLGWTQLQRFGDFMPAVSAMQGRAITTVAPSTTATALTSIATGMAPGEHGVVGYRFALRGEVLNTLRWSTASGDARRRFPAREIQPIPGFCGASVPVVTKAEFAGSGFSDAHLRGGRLCGWRATSTLVWRIRTEVEAGAPFVYAYYDGIDKVAHEFGLSGAYQAELIGADRIVTELLARLPEGTVLLITADHGQVDCAGGTVSPHPDVLAQTAMQSGEGRFRWLHAKNGAATALADAARAHHGHHAWVHTVDEVIDAGWLGPRVSPEARRRLGDVALIAQGITSFDDPADSGPYVLISRHGSLTPDEMLVPLVAAPCTR